MGRDCEQRRCLFQTHFAEIESGTDVKFLFEMNSETRALVKRSSRVGDLEKRFKVSEVSSISTLEFAWENRSLWLFGMNGPLFSYRVAQTNKLELLKWA